MIKIVAFLGGSDRENQKARRFVQAVLIAPPNTAIFFISFPCPQIKNRLQCLPRHHIAKVVDLQLTAAAAGLANKEVGWELWCTLS